VLLLHQTSRRAHISRLITGNSHPRCTSYAYRDTEDLLRVVGEFMADAMANS
jgi:hypothetical protein